MPGVQSWGVAGRSATMRSPSMHTSPPGRPRRSRIVHRAAADASCGAALSAEPLAHARSAPAAWWAGERGSQRRGRRPSGTPCPRGFRRRPCPRHGGWNVAVLAAARWDARQPAASENGSGMLAGDRSRVRRRSHRREQRRARLGGRSETGCKVHRNGTRLQVTRVRRAFLAAADRAAGGRLRACARVTTSGGRVAGRRRSPAEERQYGLLIGERARRAETGLVVRTG